MNKGLLGWLPENEERHRSFERLIQERDDAIRARKERRIQECIQERAYEIWAREGYPSGRWGEHRKLAEAEIEAEIAQRGRAETDRMLAAEIAREDQALRNYREYDANDRFSSQRRSVDRAMKSG